MNRLDVLWQLQQTDLALEEASQRLRQATSRLGESQELMQARQAAHKAAADLKKWQSHLHVQELELSSLETKIAEVQDRLYGGRVTNPKELASLQQDSQYLKRRQVGLEDDALRAMTEIDEGQEIRQIRQKELDAIETAWAKEQEQLGKLITELEPTIAALSAKRAELCKAIAPGDLQTYEEIRRRKGGHAMTLLDGNLCQSCHISIPSAKRQQLGKKAALLFCDGCGRILYTDRAA